MPNLLAHEQNVAGPSVDVMLIQPRSYLDLDLDPVTRLPDADRLALRAGPNTPKVGSAGDYFSQVFIGA